MTVLLRTNLSTGIRNNHVGLDVITIAFVDFNERCEVLGESELYDSIMLFVVSTTVHFFYKRCSYKSCHDVGIGEVEIIASPS